MRFVEKGGISTILDRNAMLALLFLREGARKESDLREVIANYYSIEATIKRISEAGLIHSWVDDTRYHARWHELTDVGCKVAMDLKRANDRLNGITVDDKGDEESNHGSPPEEGDKVKW